MNQDPNELHAESGEEPTGEPQEREELTAGRPEEHPGRALIPTKFSSVETTSDERSMAALAHGSILLSLLTGGLGGLIVALVIWGVYRDKSRWVAYQAMQAFAFQLATLLITAGLGFVTMVAGIITGALSVILIGLCLLPITLLLALLVVVFPLLAVAYGIYGALETYNGRDFRYLWLGDWLWEEMLK